MTFKEWLGLILITKFARFKGTTAVPCMRNDIVIWILNNVLKLKPKEFTISVKRYING